MESLNNKKKKIIAFTGAGVSAESGIATFRDSGGLWEEYKIDDVATPEGYYKNKELVLEFYNKRRRQCKDIQPNQGHLSLVELEDKYDVVVITQNVDPLHEKAGSKNIIHLHGELTKARSEKDMLLTTDIGYEDINLGDLASDGKQLRPHIVWFNEGVPKINDAVAECSDADILLVIGTSLNVYPAADILKYVPRTCEIYYIDPNPDTFALLRNPNIKVINKNATEGVPEVVKILNENE